MGFVTIEWDVDPQDWRRPGTPAILGNVLGNVRSGSIVLQHDGGGDRSETLAALPTEIRVLRSRGYRFVTIALIVALIIINYIDRSAVSYAALSHLFAPPSSGG